MPLKAEKLWLKVTKALKESLSIGTVNSLKFKNVCFTESKLGIRLSLHQICLKNKYAVGQKF